MLDNPLESLPGTGEDVAETNPNAEIKHTELLYAHENQFNKCQSKLTELLFEVNQNPYVNHDHSSKRSAIQIKPRTTQESTCLFIVNLPPNRLESP